MTSTAELAGRTIVFLTAAEGTEQVELTEPWAAVTAAGATPVLVSEHHGSVQAFHHLDRADTFTVDKVIGEVQPEDYDALVLPGGVANPDFLRTVPNAVRLVGEFMALGKPVAAICHAPWLLIEADVLDGRRVTSYPSLATDLRNAGAVWVDEEVVIDHGLITSRRPEDLPAFCSALVTQFAEGPQREQATSA
ncbi:type 1 glutamine amidotransferase domain-containing protein [Pseudonocardia sp. KRD291]|uniref:type 1 glutamine amidotransferase domain-containing protein n=1 Tax=Pseudonocardia sp. KRD291 TaxID=2792007 RepID=UPI001C49E0E4|nr:type 1 glutamine amidotransferase domain-containing protein [Pseudonocardia sp. KRD291]MBW0100865.1 type 1 glutamine amidotransferase [Pseudonocardia sp. KRD291]